MLREAVAGGNSRNITDADDREMSFFRAMKVECALQDFVSKPACQHRHPVQLRSRAGEASGQRVQLRDDAALFGQRGDCNRGVFEAALIDDRDRGGGSVLLKPTSDRSSPIVDELRLKRIRG